MQEEFFDAGKKCAVKVETRIKAVNRERFFTVNMFDEVPRTRADHNRRVKTPFLLIIAVCRLRNKFSCLGEIE